MERPHAARPPIMTTLPSGLRVATMEIPDTPMKACVTVDCGTRFDPDESPSILTTIFRRAVLIHMGYTLCREVTSALLEAEGKDIGTPLKHLADFVQNTGYFEHATVLAPPLKMPGAEKVFVFDKLHEVAYRNHPLGRLPCTAADSSLSVTNEQINNFLSTHFTARRMVITITGDKIKHREVAKQVKKLFKHLSRDPTSASQLVSRSPATFTASEARMLNENQSIAHFAVAFCGASTTDPDRITLEVIKKMLGSVNCEPGDGDNMGLDLASIVDVKKLAITMQAFSFNYHETGLFGVYASAEPHCLEDLAKAIMSSISKLCYHVLEADVSCAQTMLLASFARSLFKTPIVADVGNQIIRQGRRIPADEVFAWINAVDATAVKRVAKRFFFDKDVAIVAMGPIKKLPNYNWFRASTCLRNH